MKFILLSFFYLASEIVGLFQVHDFLTIAQNKPVQVGTQVTFRIQGSTTGVPNVAWDFGDGTDLGTYRKSLTVTYTYRTAGVYQVFARIDGEEIPLSTVQTVITPLSNPRPTHSSTIVFDSTSKKLWVVNADNNSVSLLDALTLKLNAEISVGKHPRNVALDKNGNAWVTNEDDATISIVRGNGQIANTIKLPYASRPFGICFDPQRTFAYVTLQGTGRLLKYNATTFALAGNADVGRSPRAIAISSNGSRVFVTQFISPADRGIIREVTPSTMAVRPVIPLAFDQTPDFEDKGRGVPNYVASMTITPDGSEAWVTAKKDNTARGVFRDGDTLKQDNTVRTIGIKINMTTTQENRPSRLDFNDSDQACAVAFSPYGNMAFVALQGNNKISIVEPGSNARLGSLDSIGLAPQGLVFNTDGSRLFVHNFMSRTVQVYNTLALVLSTDFDPIVEATISTINKELLDAQVLRGKQIFYNAQDPRMTFAGYISCATCHLDGMSDERVWDFTDRGEGFRNTHALRGRSGVGMGNVHWTGNFDEIQDFENDMRGGFGGKGFLPDAVFHSKTVSDPLGTPKAGLSPELDALAAYVKSLDMVHPSPFRNQDGSLTAEGVAGKKVFADAGCGTCHAGLDFTDRKKLLFHDVGTILPSSGKRRNGMLTGFATPTLKGIWQTAPYLHDGSAATLRDVLVTKNRNNRHGNLSTFSQTEINNLISYLMQIDENEGRNTPNAVAGADNAENFFSVYPNPATQKVHIYFTKAIGKGAKISIQNLQGVVVLSALEINQPQMILDLSSINPGVYHILFFDGYTNHVKRLLIQ